MRVVSFSISLGFFVFLFRFFATSKLQFSRPTLRPRNFPTDRELFLLETEKRALFAIFWRAPQSPKLASLLA